MLEVLDGIYVRSAQPDHAIEKDGPPPISPQHFLCHIRAGTLPAPQQVSCHPPAPAHARVRASNPVREGGRKNFTCLPVTYCTRLSAHFQATFARYSRERNL